MLPPFPTKEKGNKSCWRWRLSPAPIIPTPIHLSLWYDRIQTFLYRCTRNTMVIFPQNDNVRKYLARLPFIFFVIQSFLGNCSYLFPLETFQRTFHFGKFSEVITFASWQSYSSLFQFPRYVQYTKALETFHIEPRSHVPQFQPVQCSGRSLLKIPQCQNQHLNFWNKILFFYISGEDCGSGQAVVTRTPFLHRRPDQRSQLQDEGDDCLSLWAGSLHSLSFWQFR